MPPRRVARQWLADIRVNLSARIAEALREGWLGEADGLKIGLAGAEAKLAQVDGLIARRREAVSLSMPSFLDIAGRAAVSAKKARMTHHQPRTPPDCMPALSFAADYRAGIYKVCIHCFHELDPMGVWASRHRYRRVSEPRRRLAFEPGCGKERRPRGGTAAL